MSIPGSRWWRFDLHNHTPASSDYKGDRDILPRDWLLNYMRAGVDAIAITDHNTTSGIERMRDALGELRSAKPEGYRELALFPGVEITASDCTHLLAIFDTQTSLAEIDGVLGRIGCPCTPKNDEAICTGSAFDVAQAIHAAHGLVIAAHIDRENGLYELIRGSSAATRKRSPRTIEQLLPCLDALQVVDRNSPDMQSVLSGLNGRLAIIGASDAHKPSEITRNGAWIKCTRPTLSGLRLALIDHGLAVRECAEALDPNTTPTNWLRSISVQHIAERQASPLEISFNPAFNALIGGRGTGKSTVIEGVRLAARRGDELKSLGENSEVLAAFDRFAQRREGRQKPGMLLPASVIKVNYVRDGEDVQLTYDESGEIAAVRVTSDDAPDAQTGLTPAQIAERYPLRVMSQKQVFELSRSTRSLLELIDADPRLGKAQWQREFDEKTRHFKLLRAQFRLMKGRASALALREDELRQIGLKLKAFEQSNMGEQLKAYQRAKRQEQAKEDVFLQLLGHLQRLEGAVAEVGSVREPALGDFDESSVEHRPVLDSLRKILASVAELPASITRSIADLRQQIDSVQAQVERSDWMKSVHAATEQYQELLSNLHLAGIESPKAYGELSLGKQRLEREIAALKEEATRRDNLLSAIEKEKGSLIDLRRKLTNLRQAFIDNHVASSWIRISLREGRDIQNAEDVLRAGLEIGDRFTTDVYWVDEPNSGGVISDVYRAQDVLAEWTAAMSQFDLQKEHVLGTSLSAKLVSRLARTKPEMFDDLLCTFPEDELVLEYRQGDRYRPINQGSPGQRSAAVLSFLMSFGDEPLLLDQPEDDLDNALIYSLVVQGIRENKTRRQLIVSTHNANIVVNGDAEYVVPMRYCNGGIDAELAAAGGLQEESVRRRICEIMEGGTEAFKTRYRKVILDVTEVKA